MRNTLSFFLTDLSVGTNRPRNSCYKKGSRFNGSLFFLSSPTVDLFLLLLRFFTLMTTKKTIEINDLFVSPLSTKKVFQNFPSPFSLVLVMIQTNKKKKKMKKKTIARTRHDGWRWRASVASGRHFFSQLLTVRKVFFLSFSFYLITLFLPPPLSFFAILKFKKKKREENTPILCAYTVVVFLPLVARLLERWTDWLVPLFCRCCFALVSLIIIAPLLLKPFNFFDGWEMEKLLLLLLCTAPVIRLLQPRQ